jgi:hypothetical protein
MDEFIDFNFVRVDEPNGAKVAKPQRVRERVDLIARQFRDFLHSPSAASDDQVRGIMVTNEFKLRRHSTSEAGWLSFLVDVGDGRDEKLQEVAIMAFVRDKGDEARAALAKIAPHVDVPSLPAPPLAVAVGLTNDLPFVIREWYTKAAAGFFAGGR